MAILLSLTVVPLVLLVFLTSLVGRHHDYNRISTSYQIRMEQLQKRLNWQEDLLNLITNNDPEAVTIFDNSNCFWFVNESAAKNYGFEPKDLIGNSTSKVFSLEKARLIEARLEAVRSSDKPLETLENNGDDKGNSRFVQTRYERINAFGEFPGGIIARTENVTNLLLERERRENMLRQVIATLVAVVDRRDPFASGHSQRVGLLSRAIAEELVLTEKDIETCEIAGSLMNFGKVLVPRQLLTKTSALTEEELQRVREGILTSADILSIINFSGPVVPTLRQVLERYDGTGSPHGLKGDQILITARVVTVANAYIAMVSPRAHRLSLKLSEAVARLMEDNNKSFDKRVVAALANYVQNRAGKDEWLTVVPKSDIKTP